MMKTLFISMALIISLMGIAQNNQQKNTIEVTGKSVIEIIPDEIYLKIFINELDTKGKISVEELELKMMKKLNSLGIDVDEKLMVDGMNSDLYKAMFKKNKAQTSKSYQLIVSSAAQMAEVYIELEAVGISNISIYKVDHSNIEGLKLEANLKATQDAKHRAKAIAQSIGQDIGSAVFIRENDIYLPQQQNKRMYMTMDESSVSLGGSVSSQRLHYQKIVINGTVFVRFELLDSNQN